MPTGRLGFPYIQSEVLILFLIKNKDMILARWTEYLQNLLNMGHATDPAFPNELLILLIIANHDEPKCVEKVEKAVLSLKDNKAASPDNIPAEVIKHGVCFTPEAA